MLQSFSQVIQHKRPAAWDESDARHFVQAWLREQTRTEEVYCVSFQGGVATIQAASPAVRQATQLLEYDLREVLGREGGPELKEVKVVR